ncbi:hypothetical protein IG631_16172 [Alternaria alternata]|nr:hypothetical protein IG631_16172 [Alternaria alternata]
MQAAVLTPSALVAPMTARQTQAFSPRCRSGDIEKAIRHLRHIAHLTQPSQVVPKIWSNSSHRQPNKVSAAMCASSEPLHHHRFVALASHA